MRNTKEDVQRLHLMLWDMWGFLIVLLIEIHTEKTWADGPVVMGLKAQQVVLNPFFFNKKKLFPNFIVIFAVILVSWILMWLQLIAVVLTPFFLIDFSINFAARVFEMRTSDLGLDFFSYFDFSSYYFNWFRVIDS